MDGRSRLVSACDPKYPCSRTSSGPRRPASRPRRWSRKAAEARLGTVADVDEAAGAARHVQQRGGRVPGVRLVPQKDPRRRRARVGHRDPRGEEGAGGAFGEIARLQAARVRPRQLLFEVAAAVAVGVAVGTVGTGGRRRSRDRTGSRNRCPVRRRRCRRAGARDRGCRRTASAPTVPVGDHEDRSQRAVG